MSDKDNDKERLELPEKYKKGYNDAELVINQFPHLLEGMVASEAEHSDYTKGFEDRVEQYELEKAAIKNQSYQKIQKYGKGLDDKNMEKSKDDRTK